MIKVLFIGNKARQGKDTFANGMKNKYQNSIIFHFADVVKEEVMNKPRIKPLLKLDHHRLFILQNNGSYEIRNADTDEVAIKFREEMNKRGIEEYWGMDGNGYDVHKDPIMLQLWGTDYRRNSISKNYWVDIIKEKIKQLDDKDYIVMIPDTRFKNELELKNQLKKELKIDSMFIKIIRVDGNERILDEKRNPLHESEIDLDDIKGDITLINRECQLDLTEEDMFNYIGEKLSTKFIESLNDNSWIEFLQKLGNKNDN